MSTMKAAEQAEQMNDDQVRTAPHHAAALAARPAFHHLPVLARVHTHASVDTRSLCPPPQEARVPITRSVDDSAIEKSSAFKQLASWGKVALSTRKRQRFRMLQKPRQGIAR